jgi:hypothetical protein
MNFPRREGIEQRGPQAKRALFAVAFARRGVAHYIPAIPARPRTAPKDR